VFKYGFTRGALLCGVRKPFSGEEGLEDNSSSELDGCSFNPSASSLIRLIDLRDISI
jgi:hypothetical protein